MLKLRICIVAYDNVLGGVYNAVVAVLSLKLCDRVHGNISASYVSVATPHKVVAGLIAAAGFVLLLFPLELGVRVHV